MHYVKILSFLTSDIKSVAWIVRDGRAADIITFWEPHISDEAPEEGRGEAEKSVDNCLLFLQTYIKNCMNQVWIALPYIITRKFQE